MSLFRKEAVEAKRRRLWGEVRLAQPPGLMIWTAVCAATCLALLVGLVFGQYTRKETVRGFLAPESGMIDVRAVQPGRVARVLVREGQSVTEGTPLVELVYDIGNAVDGPVLDVQIAESARLERSIGDRLDAVVQGYAGEQTRLAEQVEAQQELRRILAEQRDGQSRVVALAEADAERIQSLQAQGFAPASEVDRRRRAVLAERNAAASLEGAVAGADARIAELRSQLAALPARMAEARASLDSESARLAQQRAELQVARGHVIRAPVDGIVSRLLVRPGLTPAGNGVLLSLAPEKSLLQAHLLVPTRAIGFLSVGQKARLHVDAFPFQRFGFVQGYVSAIHPTVVRPGDMAFPIEQTEPVYEVEVFITREYMNAYGQKRALRPGMALTADLAIDKRTLWQQLFDPLLAAGRRSAPF